MESDRYAFADDADHERTRLASVERAFDSFTRQALLGAGLGRGWRCWEVGAGRGSIARWIGQVVGPDGYVLATDLDDRWFEGDEGRVVFRHHDAAADPPPGDDFDLIHARFLLEHLGTPRSVIARLATALRPGGVLVCEDSADLTFSGSRPSPSVQALAEPWARAGAAVGWDARYGARLVDDLRAVGLRSVGAREHRVVAAGGPAWAHARDGLRRLRAEILREGPFDETVDTVLDWLDDPANRITGPAVVTAWGRRHASAA